METTVVQLSNATESKTKKYYAGGINLDLMADDVEFASINPWNTPSKFQLRLEPCETDFIEHRIEKITKSKATKAPKVKKPSRAKMRSRSKMTSRSAMMSKAAKAFKAVMAAEVIVVTLVINSWRHRVTSNGERVVEISFKTQTFEGFTYVSPAISTTILKGELSASISFVEDEVVEVRGVVDEIFFKPFNGRRMPLARFVYLNAFPRADLSRKCKILHADGDVLNNCASNLRNGQEEMTMFNFFDVWEARKSRDATESDSEAKSDKTVSVIEKPETSRVKRMREYETESIERVKADAFKSAESNANADPTAACELRVENIRNATMRYAVVKVDRHFLDDLVSYRWKRCDKTQIVVGKVGDFTIPLAYIVMGRPPHPGMSIHHNNGDLLDLRASNLRWKGGNDVLSSASSSNF